jgi:hypothetical protein
MLSNRPVPFIWQESLSALFGHRYTSTRHWVIQAELAVPDQQNLKTYDKNWLVSGLSAFCILIGRSGHCISKVDMAASLDVADSPLLLALTRDPPFVKAELLISLPSSI